MIRWLQAAAKDGEYKTDNNKERRDKKKERKKEKQK